MSRSEEFWSGRSPEEIHPHLLDREAGSQYPHIPERHVGFVDTSYLMGMRGNEIRSWDTVSKIRSDIRSGKGILDPLQVDQDVFGDGNAFVGEGNHRLAAAALEGVPYVPVTMYRKKWGRDSDRFPRFPGRRLPGKGEKLDEFYHPAKAFPADKVWPQGDAAK
jgi:hypothetical protein